MQRMAELTIDRWMSDPQRVGAALAARWEEALRFPRFRFLDHPDEETLCAWILYRPFCLLERALPVERLLFQFVANGLLILAVRTGDRAVLQRVVQGPPITAAGAPRDREFLSMDWPELVKASTPALITEAGVGGWALHREPFAEVIGQYMRLWREILGEAGQQRARGPDAQPLRELRDRELRALRAGRDRFIERLDRAALRQLARQKVPRTFAAYNLLATATEPRVRKWRAQALGACPMFAGAIAGNVGELRTAVDQGKPLVRQLAQAFGVRPALIRRLKRPNHPELYHSPPHHLSRILTVLSSLSLERVPRAREEWRALLGFLEELRDLRYALDRRSKALTGAVDRMGERQLNRAAAAGWVGPWRRFRRGFRETQGLADLEGLCASLHRLAQSVGGTAALDIDPVLLRLLDRGMEELRDISEAWHAALNEHAGLFVAQGGGLSWPPLIERHEACGLTIEPLCSLEALIIEGRKLRHCIATYAERCLFEPVHLLSVRGPQGEPLASVEVRFAEAESCRALRVVQHRGKHNRKPSRRCEEAVARLIAHLNRPEAIDLEALESARRERTLNRAAMDAQVQSQTLAREWYAARRALPDDMWHELRRPDSLPMAHERDGEGEPLD